jgi:hypothetical protein
VQVNRRPLALCLVGTALLAGCGGSATPFFLVRNDRPVAMSVTYCATQICRHPTSKLIAAGSFQRFSNHTEPKDFGFLVVTAAGRRLGCGPVPPAATMVDRLFTPRVSGFLGNSCAGYNPARPLQISPAPNPG